MLIHLQDEISRSHPTTSKGAMYCPVILGSDKTTVSVATGQLEYYPLYFSIGNLRNNVRRGHRNGVIPIGFLSIPKGLSSSQCVHPSHLLTFSGLQTASRRYDNDAAFRNFKAKIYHGSLAAIFEHMKDAMTTPIILRCPDGHYRHVVFDLAAYIADYPEQVALGGIVSGWCPKYVRTNVSVSLY